jgi:N-acetyl-anhydromuramyl-L-alanine amidase AmpD
MASQIRPNRIEINDRFPMIGFTIRTDGGPKSFEVAIASEPSLFKPDAKSRRTRANFYSSRARGPVTAARGEAVYLLPADVVARFVGNDKLYYGLAPVGEKASDPPSIPTEGSPYISLKGLTGRALRRVRVLPNRQQAAAGYGVASQKELEWAGDVVQPGMTPVASKGNGATAPSGSAPTAVKADAAPATTAHSAALADYDDGYGPLPTQDDGSQLASDDSAHGIDGPIPDADGGDGAVAASLGAAEAPEYPQANRFAPAASVNYRHSSGQRTVNRIVIHITDGGKKASGTVGWFQNPNQLDAKGRPIHVSAHYVIGRDGEVIQMVRHNDVAWHAGSANGDSIGIEHVAHVGKFNPTEAEYCASAALVAWLCDTCNIPVDRDHILGHAEADPHTTHTDCPNAVWDWDYFMHLIQTRSCDSQDADSRFPASAPDSPPAGQGQALGRPERATPRHRLARAAALEGGSFTLNWDEVELIAQPTDFSCWAAAAAMVVGWRDRVSLAPDTLASVCARTTATGLDPKQIEQFAGEIGLSYEPPQCYSVDGLRQRLEDCGPLWVAADVPGLHAIVVTGMYSGGAEDGSDTFVRIADPWDRVVGTPGAPGAYQKTHTTGSRYILNWADFVREYESAGSLPSVNLQILHAADNGGRAPNRGKPADYAMAVDRRRTQDARYRSPRATALDSPPSLSPGDVVKSGGKTYVVYANEVRSGGVYAWIDNNPGNITAGKWAENHGAFAGKKHGGFAIFPDEDTGFSAVIAYISERPDDSILALMTRYAPPDDGKNPMLKGNNPEAYARAIAAKLGVPITTVIRTLDDGQKQTFASEIQRIETGPNGSGTIYSYSDAGLPDDIKSRLPTPSAGGPDADGDTDAGVAAGPDARSVAGAGDAGTESDAGATRDGGTAQSFAFVEDKRHPRGRNKSGHSGSQALADTAPGAGTSISAIQGVTLETVRDTAGGVAWELDQLHGMKAPAGADVANRPIVDGPTIRVTDWPYVDDTNGHRVCANFFVDWHFDGQSLGDVHIINVGASDAPGYTLHVTAKIDDDPQVNSSAKSPYAALKVRFDFHFARPDASVLDATTELHLFGDGTYDQSSHWKALAA